MSNFAVLLAQAGPDPMINVFFIIAIVFVFYFFMIRPQSRRAKAQRDFLDNLEKGDRVVTIGGVHGRISKIGDQSQTLLLEVDTNGTKLKIERSVISMEFTNALYKSEAAENPS